MDENDHTIVGGATLVTGSLFLAFAFITVLDVRYLFTATIPLIVVGIMLIVFRRNARSKAGNDTEDTKTHRVHVGENRKQRREREKREKRSSMYR